jgi:hypothetical protein
MISSWITVALPLVLLYAAFWLWYGGNGKAMSKSELEGLLAALAATDQSEHAAQVMSEVRELMSTDDGKEFVMLNLVRYRPKALYPPGYSYSDDPREADKRYGKSIIGSLLRNGNLILFIARRSGNFVVPEGADAWHYTALVRYRSRRDFLRFAIESSGADKFVHKWAAIEKTHIFPVKPIVSLFAMRTLMALLLFALGALILTVAA